MPIQPVRSRRSIAMVCAAGAAGLALVLALFGLFSSEALAQPALRPTQSGIDIDKSVSMEDAEPGQTLHYTITVQNNEYSNVSVLMSDQLPAEATISGTINTLVGSVGYDNGTITWTHDMPALSWNRITFDAVISPTMEQGTLVNTASITGTGGFAATASVTTCVSATSYWYLPVVMQEYPPAPLLAAIPVPDANASYVVSWSWPIGTPSGVTQYVLQQSLTPDFATISGVYTTTSLTQVVADAFEVYYYRVRADSDTRWGIGPWSNVEAGQAAAKPVPTLGAIPAPDASASYVVSWSWPSGAPPGISRYVLEQSPSADFATISGEWQTTALSQTVANVYSAYYYRVRADSDTRWGTGSWSNVEAAQAAAKPVPTLNPIPLPDSNGVYVVSWTWPGGAPPGISRYVLQQSPSDDFATITAEWTTIYIQETVTETLQPYYYRVRADGDTLWGVGPWSNVEVGESSVYFDDFNDLSSGWPTIVKKVKDTSTNSYYRLRYQEYSSLYYYRISIDAGDPHSWFHQPDVFAPYAPPSDKYCVETRVRVYKMRDPYDRAEWNYYPYWSNGGLVFGANEANTNLYALCLTIGAGDSLGWFIVNNPTYQYPYKGCNYVQGVKGGQDAGALTITQWQRFQVSVDGNVATVYINGAYKGTFNMSGLSDTTRVGLIGGSYEINPTDFWFDWFKVIPNAACVP